MNLTKEIKSNIHMYVILELAIKSVQHDQKLFESFTVKRPYLSLCNKQLEVLKEELKQTSKQLLKQGIKFERYQGIGKSECIYYFKCRGEIIPFHYQGDALKKQVERKINLIWSKLRGEPA